MIPSFGRCCLINAQKTELVSTKTGAVIQIISFDCQSITLDLGGMGAQTCKDSLYWLFMLFFGKHHDDFSHTLLGEKQVAYDVEPVVNNGCFDFDGNHKVNFLKCSKDEVTGARCKVQGARCKVQGARCNHNQSVTFV